MTARMSVRGGLLAGVLLAAVACGGTANAPSAAASPSPTPAPLVKTATATVAGSSKTILVGPNGMTLYYYLPDKGGKITCTGQCLVNWPALLAPSGQTTVSGTSDITGKFTLLTNGEANGQQVLYNNWPMYYWIKDKQPGDTTGEGIGGKWHVATPGVAAG
jgi:predicted lipoprotein with Yx(FWY)xxD motif